MSRAQASKRSRDARHWQYSDAENPVVRVGYNAVERLRVAGVLWEWRNHGRGQQGKNRRVDDKGQRRGFTDGSRYIDIVASISGNGGSIDRVDHVQSVAEIKTV